MKAIRFGVGLTVLLTACGTQAQEGPRVGAECRREIATLCGETSDRTAIRACLTGKLTQLSAECRTQITSRAGGQRTPVAGLREMPFGDDPKQRLDFLAPKTPAGPAPLVVFIHGGGWAVGDKGAGAGAKASYYSGLGYAFASLNYRLVPNATVEQQGADIATALAYLRANAKTLGVDPDRIVVMGHSAGAHLAALVATDPAYLDAARVPMAAIKGVVLLDGAGYDVVRQVAGVRNRAADMYQAAFGADPKRQAALSPAYHTAGPNAADWLILPVASRADSTAQSQNLAAGLRKAGTRATVTPVPDSSHALLNRNLGVAGDFATGQVDAFIRQVIEG